jgi:hypothetical protein
MFVRFFKNLVTISITLNFFHLKINGQHSGINIGFIIRLIFKYQELITKFLDIF